jgi:hypothetical protein
LGLTFPYKTGPLVFRNPAHPFRDRAWQRLFLRPWPGGPAHKKCPDSGKQKIPTPMIRGKSPGIP